VGHLSAFDKNRINTFFLAAYRKRLVFKLFDIIALINKSNHQLFQQIQYPDHCLYFLLSDKRTVSHSWQRRRKGHDYTLNHINSTTIKNVSDTNFYQ